PPKPRLRPPVGGHHLPAYQVENADLFGRGDLALGEALVLAGPVPQARVLHRPAGDHVEIGPTAEAAEVGVGRPQVHAVPPPRRTCRRCSRPTGSAGTAWPSPEPPEPAAAQFRRPGRRPRAAKPAPAPPALRGRGAGPPAPAAPSPAPASAAARPCPGSGPPR